ncbi:hypothetical protein ABW19_dt0208395 [Dactylella cylindrospora]|nr:hypothetical protein ABW19_dt0208395 [Dactylella cylindrospora]
MSLQRTPTYDKSHYSWQSPSSQASQSIIDHEKSPSPDPTSVNYHPSQPQAPKFKETADTEVESKPGLPRRSTFNYRHEMEEYKHKLQEQLDGGSDAADEAEDIAPEIPVPVGRRGSMTTKPFMPGPQRRMSWDYRDKRGEMQMGEMRRGSIEGPAEGFSET